MKKLQLMHEILDLVEKINGTKVKTIGIQLYGSTNTFHVYYYDGEWSEDKHIEYYKTLNFNNLSTVQDFEDIKTMLEQMLNEAKKVA